MPGLRQWSPRSRRRPDGRLRLPIQLRSLSYYERLVKPVKKTRRITIADKIFSSEDLRRIAAIFDRQTLLAEKSNHHSTEYQVRFEDQTTLETDSPELFADESLVSTSRPVLVNMSFHDFTLNRHMSLSIRHGDGSTSDSAQITAQDEQWLSGNFLALKEALDQVRPQVFWCRKHRTFSLFLIAIGLGSLIDLAIDLLVRILVLLHFLPTKIPAPGFANSFAEFLHGIHGPWGYALHWVGLWLLGAPWAYPIFFWLERAWPVIEFDFGSIHLRKELQKRQRLYLIATLVIVPVLITLCLDAVKAL